MTYVVLLLLSYYPLSSPHTDRQTGRHTEDNKQHNVMSYVCMYVVTSST